MANLFQKSVTGAMGPKKALEKIEIPFDLNKLFSLQYEFKPLVEVIEYIFAELKKNGDKTN